MTSQPFPDSPLYSTRRSGGFTVEALVDSSLGMIKDETTSLIFTSLGVCPEDLPFDEEVAMLICGSDAQLIAKGTKLSAIVMRRTLKTLVDRNLLQGNIVTGAQMHGESSSIERGRDFVWA